MQAVVWFLHEPHHGLIPSIISFDCICTKPGTWFAVLVWDKTERIIPILASLIKTSEACRAGNIVIGRGSEMVDAILSEKRSLDVWIHPCMTMGSWLIVYREISEYLGTYPVLLGTHMLAIKPSRDRFLVHRYNSTDTGWTWEPIQNGRQWPPRWWSERQEVG